MTNYAMEVIQKFYKIIKTKINEIETLKASKEKYKTIESKLYEEKFKVSTQACENLVVKLTAAKEKFDKLTIENRNIKANMFLSEDEEEIKIEDE